MTNIRRPIAMLLVCGSTTALCPPSLATEHQPHADILYAARDYVIENSQHFPVTPQVSVGSLDSRLRLPLCSEPLQAYEPPNGIRSGRTVIGVRCEGTKPWKIFAPLRIKLPADVIAAARRLQRGDILQHADLKVVKKDIAQLHRDYFQDLRSLVGQRIRKNVKRGAVITPTAVEKPKLVRRGTEVTIMAENSLLQVRVRGKALANGGHGDRIKIKNLSSGREVTATVIGSGLVRVVN